MIHPSLPPKSPRVATLLSLVLLGGGGQLWLGQWQKGIALIVLTALLLWVTAGVWGWFMFVIGALDAYRMAAKLRAGQSVRAMEWFWSK
ncbi:MAG: hypothetical protein LC737_04870 [Chloroflexi bacterium]|nr:hypothetical protein [Chloroflexota bacterium]